MTRSKKDFLEEVTQIRDFLIESDWVVIKQSNSLTFYSPPESLGIKGKYSIALPIDSARPGLDSYLLHAVDALQSIYGFRFNRLYEKFADKSMLDGPSVLSTRFIDSTTSKGSIPLGSIKVFVEQMEKSLYYGAKFRLNDMDHAGVAAVAHVFASSCNFLQTSEGSFVARVEVPAAVLRQPQLFGEPVYSSDVCSALFSVIEFINERILIGNESFESEETILEAISLFDPELLESLSKLLTEPDVGTVEFSVQIGAQTRITNTGLITSERLDRLKSYVEFIKNYFYGEDDLHVEGTIVELRSRDPDGNKNHIKIVADFHGDRTYVSAILTNDQYQQALDAHRNKRKVVLRGSGVGLKTHIKLNRISSFDV